jgi:hypothetical protein
MVIRVIGTKASLLRKSKEVRQTACLLKRTTVYMKESPDQVHAKMKQAKTKLKDIASRPGIEIIDAHNLSSTNPSIGRLIIDAWDRILDKIVSLLLKLNKISVLMHSKVSMDRRFLNCCCPKWKLLCFMTSN